MSTGDAAGLAIVRCQAPVVAVGDVTVRALAGARHRPCPPQTCREVVAAAGFCPSRLEHLPSLAPRTSEVVMAARSAAGLQTLWMIVSASSRLKPRRVSVVTLPYFATARRIWYAVASSGASKISTRS